MSSSLNFFFLLGVFVALFAGLFFWAQAIEKKTIAALSALAIRRGWRFVPKSEERPTCFGRDIELFQRGRNQRTSYRIDFQAGGRHVEAFQFSYVSGHGKNKDTKSQTIIAVTNSKAQLPKFSLSPENVFHKIANVFGYRDINFEQDEEFSKKFRLNGNNETLIRKLFNAEVIGAAKSRGELNIQADGDTLVFFTERKVISPDQIEAAIEDRIALSQLFFS